MITIAISVKDQPAYKAAHIAVLKGDCLIEYCIWQFEQPGDIGDVYSGRITARVPAMAGSFVDLGIASGFLPDSAGGSGLTEGGYLSVQVTRTAQSGKGARLAALPEQPERKPGLIRQGLGPLNDFLHRYPTAPILVDDYALIAIINNRSRQSPLASFSTKVAFKAAAYDPVLEDEIATLSEPTVLLTAGARMHVTPTPALTAIDIDAGAATSDKSLKQHSQLRLNNVLIPEIVRQILLRNLSGAILIDFVGMKSSARPKLLAPITAALTTDPLNPKCLGFSHLGFAEIIRPRIRPPLHEFLQ